MQTDKIRMTIITWLSLFMVIPWMLNSCKAPQDNGDKFSAYLFTYFAGNGPGQEQVHYAVSLDGFNFRALNGNQPVIDSKLISSSGGVRDPHILRGNDGLFYMVLTDLYVPDMGWQNTAMILLTSPDLINWKHTVIDIPETYPEEFGEVNRVWAPQTFYDDKTDSYMLYWSMRTNEDPDKIYYAYANEEFTGLKAPPRQLYFPPEESNNRACIDGDIVFKDGKYYLYHKAEDGEPGIKLAISDKLTEGYQLYSIDRIDREKNPVEGSGIFKLIDSDEYILMYDLYTQGGYQFTRSTDLLEFEVIDQKISMNFHPRHGCVIPITGNEFQMLLDKWGKIDQDIVSVSASAAKRNNLVVEVESGEIIIPVKPGTDFTNFDPEFVAFPGAVIDREGPHDFSGEPISYTISLGNQTKTFQVSLTAEGNPVIAGYYADPEIIFSERDRKFYMYPTSDGFTNWSGKYFETFSSPDLVNWTAEGTILDLTKDVDWANRNAWAPTLTEQNINGGYKYFYYFTAAQKIGVAVADDPAGPFKDSGKPLIDFKPEGITGGQEIDPDVFTDPQTGKNYLFWGNSYLAVAELNEDLVSMDKSSMKVLTPDETFREGCEVFFRKGKYYFLWSENDTRDPDYRVRYATSDTPFGPLDIPEENLVIAKDTTLGIYATGHNSVINVPGTDDWYIVYHRFTRPRGIHMGRSAGYNREVCIDKMEFNEDGSIKPVVPTLTGIHPVSIPE